MATPISLDDLEARRTAGAIAFVEALSTDFYAAGHLPGAVNLPLSSTDGEIRSLIARIRPPIVVYGTGHGGEATELAQRIESVTGAEIMILTGGKEAWAEAGRPLESSTPIRSAQR